MFIYIRAGITEFHPVKKKQTLHHPSHGCILGY